MNSAALAGVGVLVTRPTAQAGDLMASIENAGGNVYRFPVIEIRGREGNAIANDAAKLPPADIALFVSSNAVKYGLEHIAGARIAVIGPATAAAVRAAGSLVDICPVHGHDSEALLAESQLRDVSGKNIMIVRGQSGRELLAETLRDRGASVNYLSVYERRRPEIPQKTLAAVESAWRNGKINAVTVMSVDSFRNLIDLLPEWCESQLDTLPLVTPTARVIKEALTRYPNALAKLATGPQSNEMLLAIITSQTTDPGRKQ